ncbi:hypothetical protein WISP_10239 [Willisornis vidua]|uniref:Uncharacterized protein n=1 Tax=Willisornis vidua TaxID=1566151 RepID=A0ABQ9DS81_9PASS|nr:hypothetical protein WISP_10239 [Willisornis vidua]
MGRTHCLLSHTELEGHNARCPQGDSSLVPWEQELLELSPGEWSSSRSSSSSICTEDFAARFQEGMVESLLEEEEEEDEPTADVPREGADLGQEDSLFPTGRRLGDRQQLEMEPGRQPWGDRSPSLRKWESLESLGVRISRLSQSHMPGMAWRGAEAAVAAPGPRGARAGVPPVSWWQCGKQKVWLPGQRLRELEKSTRSLLQQRLQTLHQLHVLLQREKVDILWQLQKTLEQNLGEIHDHEKSNSCVWGQTCELQSPSGTSRPFTNAFEECMKAWLAPKLGEENCMWDIGHPSKAQADDLLPDSVWSYKDMPQWVRWTADAFSISPDDKEKWEFCRCLGYSRKAETIGIVQPGEEKLWGDLTVALQCLKGPTGKMERDYLQERNQEGKVGSEKMKGKKRNLIENQNALCVRNVVNVVITKGEVTFPGASMSTGYPDCKAEAAQSYTLDINLCCASGICVEMKQHYLQPPLKGPSRAQSSSQTPWCRRTGTMRKVRLTIFEEEIAL